MEPSRGAQEAQEASVRQHLKRNRFIIKFTLFCLTLEIPFERYVHPNKSRSIRMARFRFLMFVWLSIKILVATLAKECQYSQLRALMWDWTIYYPVNNRVNLLRCFLSIFAYHVCIKASSFLRLTEKPFDASLIDFLTREPPPKETSQTEQNFVTGNSHYLRDHRHWFELAERLHTAFVRVVWRVLPPCLCVLVLGNFRLGFVLQSERACDIEMPLLRLVGLLELNYFIFECILTYLGAFTYGLMVKHDLLLQAQRVEVHLLEVEAKLQHASLCEPDLGNGENLLHTDMYLLLSSVALSSSNAPGRSDLCRWPLLLQQQQQQQHNQNDSSDPSNALVETSPGGADLINLRACIECSRHEDRSLKTTHSEGASKAPPSRSATLARKSRKRQLNLKKQSRAPLASQGGMSEARARLVLLLKCLDSHKPAISYLGGNLFIWLITSISYVPVLFSNWNALHSRSSGIIYVTGCGLAVSTSLMFMAICASVYQRTIKLVPIMFRLCAKHDSRRSAETHRWHKIFIIWFSPNRCALTVGGLFKLTHLNILKAISYLASGLTFVLSNLSGSL